LLPEHLKQKKVHRDKRHDLQYQADRDHGFGHDIGLLDVWIGLTQALSISTATDRCNRVRFRISRPPGRTPSMKPSNPLRDPLSIRTRFPTCRKGCGDMPNPDCTTLWIAMISCSSIGAGVWPIPTIPTTLGVFKMGTRADTSKRQKTYPGNSGHSTCLIRSDQRRLHAYRGKNHSWPPKPSSDATRFSWVVLTCTANHAGPSAKLLIDLANVVLGAGSRQRSHRLRLPLPLRGWCTELQCTANKNVKMSAVLDGQMSDGGGNLERVEQKKK